MPTMTSTDIPAVPDGWITGLEASIRLNVSRENMRLLRDTGAIARYRAVLNPENGQDTYVYEAEEVEAVRAARIESGQQSADTDLGSVQIDVLKLLAQRGKFEDADGFVNRPIMEALPHAHSRQSVTAAVQALAVHGFVTRNVRGRRTYSVAATGRGRKWLREHGYQYRRESPTPTPPAALDPEPEPATAGMPTLAAFNVGPMDLARPTLNGNGQGPTFAGPGEPGTPTTPGSSHPGSGAPLDVNELGSVLLRQVVRTLSDGDAATVIAERDALRVHNTSLRDRLDRVTADLVRSEDENRELRGVIHKIESALTPLLNGRDARFDLIDARTRTDLIQLIGEVAQWATS